MTIKTKENTSGISKLRFFKQKEMKFVLFSDKWHDSDELCVYTDVSPADIPK